MPFLFYKKFLYRFDRHVADLDVVPLSDDEAKGFSDALECASWKRPEGGVILAAWIALAPVSGALEWRPHLWMTGPAGTGKSWLMEHVCSKLLRGLSLYVQGATTEAGLRQKHRDAEGQRHGDQQRNRRTRNGTHDGNCGTKIFIDDVPFNMG